MKKAARPETNTLYRTICRWWKETEVLIITGTAIDKVEANNSPIKEHQTHRARASTTHAITNPLFS